MPHLHTLQKVIYFLVCLKISFPFISCEPIYTILYNNRTVGYRCWFSSLICCSRNGCWMEHTRQALPTIFISIFGFNISIIQISFLVNSPRLPFQCIYIYRGVWLLALVLWQCASCFPAPCAQDCLSLAATWYSKVLSLFNLLLKMRIFSL